MSKDYALSQESAREELDKFLDYYEVDLEDLKEETKEAVESLFPVVIKGLRKGLIEFVNDDENGQTIIQTTRSGSKLKYKEMNGQAKMAMNKKNEDDANGKCYALLGSLCGEGETIISKLKGPDLKRAEHIGGILLFC